MSREKELLKKICILRICFVGKPDGFCKTYREKSLE